jgi:prepilin-type N-terminal cleavage/methylation domain-containing protein
VPTTLILSGEKNVKKFDLKKRNQRRGGFTLIELVMVIMILAIVAGLAVPIVGWLRRSANYAAQANTQAALASNLEYFRATFGNNNYPNRMDSLVMTGGSDPIYDPTNGIGHDSGLDTDLFQIDDLLADETASLSKFVKQVMDHDPTSGNWLQGNPGNSAIVERAFDGTSTAVVARGNFQKDGTTALTGEGLLLTQEIYPDGVPSDVTLVAFGLGRSNTAVGRTLQSAPLDSRVDNSSVYGRFIGVFAVYNPREGRRAQLKAVLNAKGRTQNNALSEFWQSNAPE